MSDLGVSVPVSLLQFAHLLQIQRRVGRERFPLIEQSYYPNHKEMVSNMWVSGQAFIIFS